jgi:hypothetical protein
MHRCEHKLNECKKSNRECQPKLTKRVKELKDCNRRNREYRSTLHTFLQNNTTHGAEKLDEDVATAHAVKVMREDRIKVLKQKLDESKQRKLRQKTRQKKN